MGRTFLGWTSCCSYVTVSSGDFLRFRKRTDPLVVVELLRGRVCLFLQKHQLCVEQEAALFWQVSCRPLDCENVASLLAGSCEEDSGVQMFLPSASRTRQRSDTCSGSTLLPSSRSVPICTFHRPRQFAPPRRTPHLWDESCCPVPATISRWILGLSRRTLVSRAVHLSVAASFLLICKATQSFADPGPSRSDH